jgi:hypothetical protein
MGAEVTATGAQPSCWETPEAIMGVMGGQVAQNTHNFVILNGVKDLVLNNREIASTLLFRGHTQNRVILGVMVGGMPGPTKTLFLILKRGEIVLMRLPGFKETSGGLCLERDPSLRSGWHS